LKLGHHSVMMWNHMILFFQFDPLSLFFGFVKIGALPNSPWGFWFLDLKNIGALHKFGWFFFFFFVLVLFLIERDSLLLWCQGLLCLSLSLFEAKQLSNSLNKKLHTFEDFIRFFQLQRVSFCSCEWRARRNFLGFRDFFFFW
jgi:hypothetical protein